jgi:FMN phosphatase YigB (HAD superfamily)
VGIRAVLFDVGDTLIEGWAPRERLNELTRERLRREFADRDWYGAWLGATIEPPRSGPSDLAAIAAGHEDLFTQQTDRWSAAWFRKAGIRIDDIAFERLCAAMCVPLSLVSTPVPGAFEALRWCKTQGLKVVLASNTLWRGDAQMWDDLRRYGLDDAVDGVVTSHTVGWQKPHRRIFERALELVGARADEAVMVGDRLLADIWGAKRLGMRAVLRRTAAADQAAVDVTPDAVIADLTELPAVLRAFMDVPTAQTSLRPPRPAAR